jgi:predicted DNA-binding transcriptional regulator YafY
MSHLFEQEIYYDKKWIIPEAIINITYYSASELASIAYIFKNMNDENPYLYSKTIELFNQLHEKVSHSIYKQSTIEDILATKKDEFYLIKNAIDSEREIEFRFYTQNKYVQPLRIANLEKYWYLLCFDLLENRFSKYPIKGIFDINILDKKFSLSDHRYINKLDNAINAFFDIDKEIDVILKLAWDAKKVLSRKQLNPTQKIYQNDDEEYIMEIKITNLMEIIPTIQQWIPLIEVISPQELKDKIQSNLKNYSI